MKQPGHTEHYRRTASCQQGGAQVDLKSVSVRVHFPELKVLQKRSTLGMRLVVLIWDFIESAGGMAYGHELG